MINTPPNKNITQEEIPVDIWPQDFYESQPETEEVLIIAEDFEKQQEKEFQEMYEEEEDRRFVENIREEMEDKIIEFIADEENKNKILLMNTPAGSGRTVTTILTLQIISDLMDVQTVFLGPRIEQIEEAKRKAESFTEKEWDHLKGFEYYHNIRNSICPVRIPNLKSLEKFYINILDVVIKPHLMKMKQQNKICPYEEHTLKKFNEIIKENKSWFGQHSHLITKFVKETFERSNKQYKCLVLDEKFIDIFLKVKEVTIDDLEKFVSSLDDLWISKNLGYLQKQQLNALVALCYSLRDIVDDTQIDKEYRSYKFIESLLTRLSKKIESDFAYEYHNDSPNKNFEWNIINAMDALSFKRNEKPVLKNVYVKYLQEVFLQPDKSKWFKDIFDELFSIAELAYKFFKRMRIYKNINFPAHTHVIKKIDEKENITYSKVLRFTRIDWEEVRKRLPNVPIIILDASTSEDIYSLLAEKIGRKLEVFPQKPSPIFEYNRNIIQITDGFYYKKSLRISRTWYRLMGLVTKIIDRHRKDGVISLIIPKEFEEGLKSFLYVKGYKEEDFIIKHFGDVRGLNEMENCKVLIIIGDFEPNIDYLRDMVGAWYEGDMEISIRCSDIKENGRQYTDERLQMFVKSVRENELEQDIERQRWFLSGKNKICYLLTKQPISFPTVKMDIDDLKRDLEGKFLSEIEERILEALKNGPTLKTNLWKKVGGSYETFHNKLLKLKNAGKIKIEPYIRWRRIRGLMISYVNPPLSKYFKP